MASYRFFFVECTGETKAAETHEFKDDLDALEKARQLADGCEIEVWLGPLRIAHVKAGDEPPLPSDPIPG
jgi:hypothetical protein